jgi:uncharacterized hydrophobic protein (TIGR00271 family)
MIHLRIVTPPDRTEAVLELLLADPAVCDVVTLRDAARRPSGDLLMADVAREDASLLLADLHDLGIHRSGTITVEHVETAFGPETERAKESARGEEADAVVWEEVQTRTSEEAHLSISFVTFMMLAASIGAAGLFTDNPILIVGAMVVSPDFGPLAGVCVGLVTGRRRLALRSGLAILVGFSAASATACALAGVLLLTGTVQSSFSVESSGLARLIASPDAYTFIVAFCAGVAGMLSLTTAKSGALIGVFISVTTIPAASDIGISIATGDGHGLGGSLLQLVANITTIIVAGVLTLAVQRIGFSRKRRRHSHLRGRRAAGPKHPAADAVAGDAGAGRERASDAGAGHADPEHAGAPDAVASRTSWRS